MHIILYLVVHIYPCVNVYIYTAVPTDMAHSVGGCFMHPWGFGFKLVVTPSSCGTEWGGFGLLWERADLLREGSLNGRSLGVSKGQSSIQELELQKGQLSECQLYKGDLMKRRWRLIHLRVRMLNKG